MVEPVDGELAAEDAKLVVLARSARLRAYTPAGETAEGAAVRDTDGRTYAAATVGHRSRPELATSALRAAVVAAAASGARRFEAAAVVSEAAEVGKDDLAVLAEFGPGVPVFLAGPDGVARTRTTL
ncbi:MAG: cytidine deaminase [Frankia sp.]|nr:cytidine deaminase [Frankia sp.]